MNKIYLKYIIATIVILYTPFFAISQKVDVGAQKKADRLYVAFNYKEAAEVYEKLLNANTTNARNFQRLADSYIKLGKYTEAERVLEQLNAKFDNANYTKSYAEVLKLNTKYELAKSKYLEYLRKSSDTLHINNEILGCDSAINWMQNTQKYIIINQKAINTNHSEFGVFRSSNKVFYVAESNTNFLKKENVATGKPFLSIKNGIVNDAFEISNPSEDKSIYNDEKFNSGPIVTNKSGSELFVTQNYEGKKGELSYENNVKFNTKNLSLNIFTKKDNQWIETPFAYNNEQKYSVGHAALSNNDQILYFVSDMPGGFGGTDLWYSERLENNSWSKPINAGSVVNTAKNEMFPSIGLNDTLYFSSNGHVGMGGLDIFKSSGEKTDWTKPENLKYPINSSRDDFSIWLEKLSADSTLGYFSSNREGGIGSDDIYSFQYFKPKPLVFALAGTVKNKGTGLPLNDVKLSLYANGNKVLVNSPLDTNYFIALEPNTDYSIVAFKPKFLADSLLISTKGLTESKVFSIDLSLDSLFEIGKVIEIPNIYYDYDKDFIREDAARILDGLVRTMIDNPTLQVELGSHTDSRGDRDYNYNLSKRRAISAVNYMVEKGIDQNRIRAKGYGESDLINACKNGVECTEEEHQVNRRTTFKILKF